jgi:hypothetical protein
MTMSNYPNVAAEAGDKYLAMLAQGQDQIVEFVRSSKELMPPMPAGFSPKTPAMPFGIPTAREVADAQFDFVTKLLKQQEGFVRKLYKLPVARSSSKQATSAPAKRASAKSGTKTRRTAGRPKAVS